MRDAKKFKEDLRWSWGKNKRNWICLNFHKFELGARGVKHFSSTQTKLTKRERHRVCVYHVEWTEKLRIRLPFHKKKRKKRRARIEVSIVCNCVNLVYCFKKRRELKINVDVCIAFHFQVNGIIRKRNKLYRMKNAGRVTHLIMTVITFHQETNVCLISYYICRLTLPFIE